MVVPRTANIPVLASASEYFDFFDGVSKDVPERSKEQRLASGLLKSYLLETVDTAHGASDFQSVLRRSELASESIGSDGQLFRVIDKSGAGVALIERISGRFLSFYTLLPSQNSDRIVRKAVSTNPLLDHLWLSSDSFYALWDHVKESNSGRRYGRLTFEHESVFDLDDNVDDPNPFEDERRASRFTMVDRLEEIDKRMRPLQETYDPLGSITHLRIPANGRGGHDLYYDGKVTNRSESFLNHRSTLLYVVDMYSQLTSAVEDRLWVGEDGEGGMDGAVAELVFNRPLSEATFRRWVLSLFNNPRNRFRISGFHTWLSPRKVHANAIDQHLWQPMLMELTPERIVAVLPRGTCGNSVNRLVSNVQRFLDPRVEAFIGDVNYASLIPRTDAVNVG
ncbi:hypothetical protein [Cryptosporangium sp. NPDC051539]|uniref:hypothetical protein n=1 Tax=Cryptosporangium sp. NPDC051539 TaxID=3363962 RepID=UPI0037B5E58D